MGGWPDSDCVQWRRVASPYVMVTYARRPTAVPGRCGRFRGGWSWSCTAYPCRRRRDANWTYDRIHSPTRRQLSVSYKSSQAPLPCLPSCNAPVLKMVFGSWTKPSRETRGGDRRDRRRRCKPATAHIVIPDLIRNPDYVEMKSGKCQQIVRATEPMRRARRDKIASRRALAKSVHPRASCFSSASRSSSARLIFWAAVFSCPQAASISRPRGVRTGALIPPAKMMFENDRMRWGVEHS